MADERLRELERTWRESGTDQDMARWLCERVRRGALDPTRLRAAATLGHRPSVLALAHDRTPTPTPHDHQTAVWLAVTVLEDPLEWLRVLCAAARGRWTGSHLLDTVESFLDRPDREHGARVVRVVGEEPRRHPTLVGLANFARATVEDYIYPTTKPTDHDALWDRFQSALRRMVDHPRERSDRLDPPGWEAALKRIQEACVPRLLGLPEEQGDHGG